MRYRNYYYDTETGLYYLQTRYYDTNTGRFINEDEPSLLAVNGSSTIGANLFAYCNNNPVMGGDSSGYFVANIIGAIIGAVGGIFIGLAIANYFHLSGWGRWASTASVALLMGVIGWFSGPAIFAAIRAAICYAVSVGSLLVNQISSLIRQAMDWASQCQIPQKIINQMAGRGWTTDSIKNVINTATKIYQSTNMANENPSTCYYISNNCYVIVDNITKTVIQISNRLDPNWVPDSRIIFK
jgi:RHS repeat-associated protein